MDGLDKNIGNRIYEPHNPSIYPLRINESQDVTLAIVATVAAVAVRAIAFAVASWYLLPDKKILHFHEALQADLLEINVVLDKLPSL